MSRRDTTTFAELSKRDQKALIALSKRLGIPLTACKTHAKVKKMVRKGHELFQDEPVCKYRGGLAFWIGHRVIDICHEIGHALFLGTKLWKSIPKGTADFGDNRWKGNEEGPVMYLQVEIGHCLKDYGGAEQIHYEMEKFGYGFSTSGTGVYSGKFLTAAEWFKRRHQIEPKTSAKLKVYESLKIDINYEEVIVARV